MTSQDVRGLLAPPGSGTAPFLLRILSEAGSMNLALALSTNAASKAMVQEIREATRGLLALKAVYYESECLRFLRPDEEERLAAEWGLPVTWLRMGHEGKGRWRETGILCPPDLLTPLLLANNIAWILAPEQKVLNWLSLVPGIGPARMEAAPQDIAPLPGTHAPSLEPS